MSLIDRARALQRLDRFIPIRWRLPLRFRAQSLLGALEPEIALLPDLLRSSRGRTALDIGANFGIYTYALSKLGLQVEAFEPQPACCEVIAAWSHGSSGVAIRNTGVGASPGELTLHIPVVDGKPVPTRASFQHSQQQQVELRVPVVSLDTLDIRDVAFVKIDVEGFELQVLEGAVDLLRRTRPVMLIEIDRQRHSRESFDAILRLLSDLGYGCHVYERAALTACEDPWSASADLYNFIFIANDARPG